MGRRDGKKVKNIDGMHGLMTHVMTKRAVSDVFINQKMDVTELISYLEKKRKEPGNEKMTYFHIFCTAFGKLIYNRPLLNRFVINKSYYDRNEVTISFVAKREFTDNSEENFSVIKIKEDDNINSVSKQIFEKVNRVRTSQLNNADKFMDTVGKLPKFLKSILMGIVKFADNHDLLPNSLIGDSIYHTSLIVSNLGSIKCGAIYHHLTDFGTNSILVTIGEIKDEPVVINGKVTVRKMCEFGAVIDERIADGFYFVKSLQLLEQLFQNPKLLEESAIEKIPVTTPEKK